MNEEISHFVIDVSSVKSDSLSTLHPVFFRHASRAVRELALLSELDWF